MEDILMKEAPAENGVEQKKTHQEDVFYIIKSRSRKCVCLFYHG
jgi:hypothetical protein